MWGHLNRKHVEAAFGIKLDKDGRKISGAATTRMPPRTSAEKAQCLEQFGIALPQAALAGAADGSSSDGLNNYERWQLLKPDDDEKTDVDKPDEKTDVDNKPDEKTDVGNPSDEPDDKPNEEETADQRWQIQHAHED